MEFIENIHINYLLIIIIFILCGVHMLLVDIRDSVRKTESALDDVELREHLIEIEKTLERQESYLNDIDSKS